MVISGCVYKLTYGNLNYIGSTTKTAKRRYKEHEMRNGASSGKLFAKTFEEGGTVSLEILEELASDKVHLIRQREQHYIENTENVVNIRKAYVSEELHEQRRLQKCKDLRNRYKTDPEYRAEQKQNSVRQYNRKRRKKFRFRKHKSKIRRLLGQVHCSYA